MTAIEHDFHSADVHPIDMVETLAEQCDWDFDRVGEDQIAMSIEGAWRTYQLTLAWSGREGMLRLVATCDLNPPEERMGEFLELLNLVNDRIWNGHFTLWTEEGMLAYRYGLTLAGEAMATPEQIEAMVLSAVLFAERYYPALQMVCWGNESPEAALKLAIDEAYGTA